MAEYFRGSLPLFSHWTKFITPEFELIFPGEVINSSATGGWRKVENRWRMTSFGDYRWSWWPVNCSFLLVPDMVARRSYQIIYGYQTVSDHICQQRFFRHYPFLPPLKPLDDWAAMQTFIDIADDSHENGAIQKLLDFTGNLPLAVSLIASVAGHEGCDATLARWKNESTRLLSDGYDKKSSLDISIMLSFSSARMTYGAQQLLSILSLLPDGLSDMDLSQSQLPISNVLESKATLLRTSLAYLGKNQRLTALVPIRGTHSCHISSQRGPEVGGSTIFPRRPRYLEQLPSGNIAEQLSANLGNANAVLLDALKSDYSDAPQTLRTVIYLSEFNQESRMPKSTPAMHISQAHPTKNEKNDMDKSLECHKLALAQSTDSPPKVERKVLCDISTVMALKGNPADGQIYAYRAHRCAEDLGALGGQARALYSRALSLRQEEAEVLVLKTKAAPDVQQHYLVGALIDIATATDLDAAERAVAAARHMFDTAFAYPLGVLYCDMASADLYLRRGELFAAKPGFQQCLSSFWYTADEGVTFCLERLADLESSLGGGIHTTLRWAGIFLAVARVTRNQLAATKALCCFGHIYDAEGDITTAFKLFHTALCVLTLMDAHEWRAKCMVAMADIWVRQGHGLLGVGTASNRLLEKGSCHDEVDRQDPRIIYRKCLDLDLEPAQAHNAALTTSRIQIAQMRPRCDPEPKIRLTEILMGIGVTLPVGRPVE
ncbi:hypothetical protein DFH09DRAFT_1445437 [Mycena vulgaris]|nr:hypothetical protein DFH09DRAFT_1445437 [Mycena vulgaris]